MRNKLLFALFFLFILVSAANADLKYTLSGFRDLKWGDSHRRLGTDCILVDKELDYGTVYSKCDEDLILDDVQLQEITYCFFQDRLLNVTVEIASKKDYEKLKEFAFTTFGEGLSRKTSSIESYRWDDENIFIILDFIPQTSEGQLLVTYLPILEEVVQEIEKRRSKVKPTTPKEMDDFLN